MNNTILYPMDYKPELIVEGSSLKVIAKLGNGNPTHICTLDTDSPPIIEALKRLGFEKVLTQHLY